MSEIFDFMLSAYPMRTSDDKRNAVYEGVTCKHPCLI